MTRRPAPPVRVAVAVLAVGVGLLALATSPAAAQSCSGLDPSGTDCRIAVGTPSRPAPGGVNRGTESPPGPTYKTTNSLVPCDAGAGGGWIETDNVGNVFFDLAPPPGAEPPELDNPGTLWVGELVDPVTGPTNTGFITCVGEAEAAPAPPPPPPTAEEIWDEALTTQPSIELDPVIRGMTGLETEMWYQGGEGGTIAVGPLNGYAVTATIAPVEFIWDMGGPDRDGVQIHASSAPGSPEAPAATHTYATPGPKPITHSVVWAGSAVITGPGFPAGGLTIDLGTATLVVARDYDVIEVRTPVVGGDGATNAN